MSYLGTCEIEQTVSVLERTIDKKKMQMQNARVQSGSSSVVSQLFSEIFARAGVSSGQMSIALQQGGEFAQNFIKKAQKSLDERPWDVLLKVAIYSFAIGLFLSRRNKKTPVKGGKE